METPEFEAPLTEAAMWHAIKTRNGRYDGRFVFGVLSTHIYCRPSCPSRRPIRDKVVFFPGPAQAAQSGFRACQRCKPDDDAFVNPRAKLVRDACSYLESHRESKVTLSELGKAIGFNPSYLQHAFKEAVGITPRQYVEELQLWTARSQLKDGQSVRRSTYSSGHSSTAWLYSGDMPKLGMSPGTFKAGGVGMTIKYAASRCGLGWVMVGETADGVCSVSLGDSKEELRRYLGHEFPQAQLVEDSGTMSTHLGSIISYLDGQRPVSLADLPLNVRATAFQRRVWKELQNIPYGQTSTYSEIAGKIGSPAAVRAVANVCAANPVALIVPCHRVIRKDGSLGGYKWGLERKQALLSTEAKLSEEADQSSS